MDAQHFFLTLSSADLKWYDLFFVISKENGSSFWKDQINNLSYFEKCKLLNDNPVSVTRHFQYRVESFFIEILIKPRLLGKVLYHAIRVEFQYRGSAHIHAFLWVCNPPTLTQDSIEEFTKFVDNNVQAYLPTSSDNPKLHDVVKTYQLHRHSKSCKKYKGSACRYNFGKYFTDHTIIAVPISENIEVQERAEKLAKRSYILSKVKGYIDTNLNSNNDIPEDLTVNEVLTTLRITEVDYYEALSTSSSDGFEIHLRRPPNSCFINNYNPTILHAWRANIDIQPVFNFYKAVSYMCAYFSKSETATSEALNQASKEIKSQNLDARQATKKISAAYSSSPQISLQEAVWHCLPELYMRKCFPKTIYINTSIPNERIRMCKSKKDLEELGPDSNDIFLRNLADRYMDRPTLTYKNGKFSKIAKMCLAVFAAH